MIRSARGTTLQFIIAGIIILQFSCSKSNSTGTNPPPTTKKWVVSTFAGSGQQSSLDGTGTAAAFYWPHGMTIDSKGNLYVGDGNLNFNIRKIDPLGKVTTYEGTTVSPSLDWQSISGLTTDGQDNLYVVRYKSVAKIIAPKNLSVFAGSTGSFMDGPGLSAGFTFIADLTSDANGNLYITDYNASNKFCVRKITPGADVSTLNITDNTGITDTASGFLYIIPITVDPNGNIYVAAKDNNVIKKIDPQGAVTVFAGETTGFKDGKGMGAMFRLIEGLTADQSGNIYVSDVGNNAIRKITPDGTVTTIAGTGAPGFADGDGTAAKFKRPIGIVVDKNGIVYVADFDNNRIRKIEYK